ncbi:MAG: DUF3034 family protein [Methylacidiphilales bacterium]|nr:DUF3034 family protein [Candidatus Methylacidiphilales bacterium]
MKARQSVRIRSVVQSTRIRVAILFAASLFAASWNVNADEATTNATTSTNVTTSTNASSNKSASDPKEVKSDVPAATPDDKGPPLPLHQIEGNGGIFSTLSAYIVNPPRDGEPVGRPSVGAAFISLGHDKDLEALTITESPLKRLELGYGWNYLNLGNLPLALRNAGLVKYQQNEVQLHNFNARLQVLEEGEFDQKWLPALTFGVHYKYNDGISEVNRETFGALSSHGITKDNGTDFTLYASKTFTQLPRPVILEVGGRATEAVWDGLGGFTDQYNFVFEGNLVVLVTNNFALAAEFKQQPRDYQAIGNLVQVESNWWTLDAAYVVNKHLTFAAGYAHFGNVLNDQSNGVFGITTKWEF